MKTIYAEAQPGKVVLKEKEIPAPGKGEVLLKAKYSAMSPRTENGLLGEHIVPLPTSIGYAIAAGGRKCNQAWSAGKKRRRNRCNSSITK